MTNNGLSLQGALRAHDRGGEACGEVKGISLSLEVGARPTPLSVTQIQRGDLLNLQAELPAGPDGEATLVLQSEGRSRRWPIYIARRDGVDARLVRAITQAKASPPSLVALERLSVDPEASPLIRHYALLELGRATRREGLVRQTVAWWGKAGEQAQAEGLGGLEMWRWTACAHVLQESHQLEEAQRYVERARAALKAPWAHLSHLVGYTEALIQVKQGRYREARRKQREWADWSWYSAQDLAWLSGLDVLSTNMVLSGDLEQAQQIYEQMDRYLASWSSGPRPQSHFRLMGNISWGRLLMAERGFDVDLSALEARLRMVIEALGEAKRDADYHRRTLAQLYLVRGDWQAAQALLAQVETYKANRNHRLLEAEALRQAGRLEEALAVAVEATQTPSKDTPQWQGLALQGQILLALSRPVEALDAYAAAFDEVQRFSQMVSFGASRGRYFEDRRALVKAYVQALLEAGAVSRAFVTVANAQGQLLRSVEPSLFPEQVPEALNEERLKRSAQFWQASNAYNARVADCAPLEALDRQACVEESQRIRDKEFDALLDWLNRNVARQVPPRLSLEDIQRGLGEGEALLLVFKGAARWYSLLYTDGVVQGWREAAAPDVILSQWADHLASVDHVYLSTGGLAQDLHLAEHPEGGPWATRISLSYLPSPAHLLRTHIKPRSPPVLVSNPQQNLLRVEQATPALKALLPDGLKIVKAEAATVAQVRPLVAGASAFIFAGHGSDECGDMGGCLVLHDNKRFALGEVLMMGEGPALAFIVACHGEKQAGFGASGAVGLADAFLTTGTRTVIAADGEVDEAEAVVFLKAMLEADALRHPAAAYRKVAAALSKEGRPIWRRFRIKGLRWRPGGS